LTDKPLVIKIILGSKGIKKLMRFRHSKVETGAPHSYLQDRFKGTTARPMIWRVLFIVSLIFSIVCSGLIGFAAYWTYSIGAWNPNPERIAQLKTVPIADNSLVFDSSGKKIGEFFDRYQIYTPVSDLPEQLVQAILAIEDRNFWKHRGVDPQGIARAAWSRITKGKITQGGSTLTQQLVKQKILTSERSLERKVLEMAYAIKVEKMLSKSEILELYTNTLFLGHGSYGVAAAARRYFNKNVRDLTVGESALIAGLFQSPSRYNPAKYPDRAKARQRQVLAAMIQAGFISKQQYKEALTETLQYRTYTPLNASIAPWFIDWVRDESARIIRKSNVDGSGLRIYTTLDSALQRTAESSIRAYGSRLKSLESQMPEGSPLEASSMSIAPKTGAILSMVGGRDYDKSQFNRAIDAQRSPGSIIKPAVYTAALLKGWKWSDVIYVAPINVDNYKPRTPEQDFLTETTMLRALYRSMNTPTIEIAKDVGMPFIIQTAQKLGIDTPIKNELGSALGSSDTSMVSVLKMYASFANNGLRPDVYGIERIERADGTVIYDHNQDLGTREKAIPTQIAFLMREALRDVLLHGTAHASSNLARVAFGKTGTSNEAADNWFCGSTTSVTTAVWVGSDLHHPLPSHITASSLALPIWDAITRKSLEIMPPKNFDRPNSVYSLEVHPQYGNQTSAGVTMWFLNHQSPSQRISALQSIEQNQQGAYRRVFSH
jgi:1A family penicillin-binding protein